MATRLHHRSKVSLILPINGSAEDSGPTIESSGVNGNEYQQHSFIQQLLLVQRFTCIPFTSISLACDCQVLPEYLSCVLMSPWKGSLPSPPCQLEGEEEQVLFVSALEVLLENK